MIGKNYYRWNERKDNTHSDLVKVKFVSRVLEDLNLNKILMTRTPFIIFLKVSFLRNF